MASTYILTGKKRPKQAPGGWGSREYKGFVGEPTLRPARKKTNINTSIPRSARKAGPTGRGRGVINIMPVKDQFFFAD